MQIEVTVPVLKMGPKKQERVQCGLEFNPGFLVNLTRLPPLAIAGGIMTSVIP